jgi:Short C-terminal domain
MMGPSRRVARRTSRRVSRRHGMMDDMNAPEPEPQQYAAPPPQAPAAPATPPYMAELEQLGQLKAQGIISEEEFEAKKKQILGL